MKDLTLLVLDDAVVASLTLAKAIESLVPEAHVLRAQSLREARILKKYYDFDLHILRERVSDGSGLDLLRSPEESEEGPASSVLLLCESHSELQEDQAEALGVWRIVRKPADALQVASVVHQQWYLPRVDSDDRRFSASLKHLTPCDVLQLKLHDQATTTLEFVPSVGRCGRLYVDQGKLVHAEVMDHWETTSAEGFDALREVLSWKTGRVIELPLPAPRHTLTGRWQELMMSALASFDLELGPPLSLTDMAPVAAAVPA